MPMLMDMLSKSAQRTTFSPWSESPTLPFVRLIVNPKNTFSASFLRSKGANLQDDGDDSVILAIFDCPEWLEMILKSAVNRGAVFVSWISRLRRVHPIALGAWPAHGPLHLIGPLPTPCEVADREPATPTLFPSW